MAAELGAGFGATVKSTLAAALSHPEAVRLEFLELTASYMHNLVKSEATEGSIGVAIGPATLAISRKGTREETTTGNLNITARYVGRDQPELPAGG